MQMPVFYAGTNQQKQQNKNKNTTRIYRRNNRNKSFLIMDKIIQGVKETEGGHRMSQELMKILCYADDAILLAEIEDDLQKLQTTADRFICRYLQ